LPPLPPFCPFRPSFPFGTFAPSSLPSSVRMLPSAGVMLDVLPVMPSTVPSSSVTSGSSWPLVPCGEAISWSTSDLSCDGIPAAPEICWSRPTTGASRAPVGLPPAGAPEVAPS